jgi:tRNA U34 5-carboxymethylaminomethyl modifying GTPase MnmE/TrmE
VIDVTNKQDFEDYKRFITENQTRLLPNSERITLIINKMDLVSSVPTYISQTNGFIECSAKTGEGLLDILEQISKFKDVAEGKIYIDSKNKIEDQSSETEDIEYARAVLKKYEGKF